MEGNVSGYVCNHGSPNGERDTASPRLWAMLRTQASDEEADDVFSRRHLYCGTPVVTSWAVAGQQVVFLHMYLQTRVTLRAFPVATPRGRSVSFPIRGTMVTYVTWDDFSFSWELWFAPHWLANVAERKGTRHSTADGRRQQQESCWATETQAQGTWGCGGGDTRYIGGLQATLG